MGLTPAKINDAVRHLRDGKTIAYPTEAVYGLGCDPFNAIAVYKILRAKHRNVAKGLILVASDWSQIEDLVEPIAPPLRARALESWPGPVTWVFPASDLVPNWIRGDHRSVALRVSAHPLIQQLCQQFGGPIVSTSANLEGQTPIRDYRTVRIALEKKIDYILEGYVSGEARPTQIRDAITDEVLRR